jgi:hypothetical protein
MNVITDLKDPQALKEQIKHIWNVDNGKRVVKCSVAFGTILQKKVVDKEGNVEYKLEASHPSFDKSCKNGPPMVVNNEETLDTFCEYVLASLQEIKDGNTEF